MIRTALLASMFTLLAIAGCDQKPDATEKPSPSPQFSDKPSTPMPVPEIQSAYTLEIVASDTTPKRYGVKSSAQVNTGGWKMTTDRVLVEDSMGQTVARVYVTLEGPGTGEMVTQATQILAGEHDAKDRAITAAELSIRKTVRGADSTSPAAYSIVKRVP